MSSNVLEGAMEMLIGKVFFLAREEAEEGGGRVEEVELGIGEAFLVMEASEQESGVIEVLIGVEVGIGEPFLETEASDEDEVVTSSSGRGTRRGAFADA